MSFLHFGKDGGILYDFIDEFRPIIRKTVIKWAEIFDSSKYVEEGEDNNGRTYYYISDPESLIILFENFKEVMTEEFPYQDTILPLRMIMEKEALNLSEFFLKKKLFTPWCLNSNS
ncbi:MAG: hypothetical protein EAX96_18490 [Candidatus Lokiarchaeota archaeon]|nr:hypothetical protein [Candidatus Lokiarchaeota archaeon]